MSTKHERLEMDAGTAVHVQNKQKGSKAARLKCPRHRTTVRLQWVRRTWWLWKQMSTGLRRGKNGNTNVPGVLLQLAIICGSHSEATVPLVSLSGDASAHLTRQVDMCKLMQ